VKAVRLAVTVGDTVSIGPDGRLAIGAGGSRYAWITKYSWTWPKRRIDGARVET
jgi:hypothetical protein